LASRSAGRSTLGGAASGISHIFFEPGSNEPIKPTRHQRCVATQVKELILDLTKILVSSTTVLQKVVGLILN
jgi:hypothetical protein